MTSLCRQLAFDHPHMQTLPLVYSETLCSAVFELALPFPSLASAAYRAERSYSFSLTIVHEFVCIKRALSFTRYVVVTTVNTGDRYRSHYQRANDFQTRLAILRTENDITDSEEQSINQSTVTSF